MVDAALPKIDDIAEAASSAISASADPDPDPKTLQEEKEYEKAEKAARLKSLRQNIEERKEYAKKIYHLIVWWLVGVFVVLLLNGFGWLSGFELSDKVLITLIGGTTVNVLGIFAIVANYLFNKKG